MINIDEYSEKMKNAELFQGMGFQKIIKLSVVYNILHIKVMDP